jgi:putative chitinase
VITDAQLTAFLPRAPVPARWTAALNAAMTRFAIDSTPRTAAFLAQVAHESGGFTRMVENLSYTAPRLVAVWPKRFPTLEAAFPFARQPEKLANRVYANRLGNGDSGTGDGWRFRGRGLLQITGRGNYRAIAAALQLPLETAPEQVETPEVAALAAAQFWQSRGLNELADDRNDDNDDEDFVTITVIINGGRNGLSDRRGLWSRAKAVLM